MPKDLMALLNNINVAESVTPTVVATELAKPPNAELTKTRERIKALEAELATNTARVEAARVEKATLERETSEMRAKIAENKAETARAIERTRVAKQKMVALILDQLVARKALAQEERGDFVRLWEDNPEIFWRQVEQRAPGTARYYYTGPLAIDDEAEDTTTEASNVWRAL